MDGGVQVVNGTRSAAPSTHWRLSPGGVAQPLPFPFLLSSVLLPSSSGWLYPPFTSPLFGLSKDGQSGVQKFIFAFFCFHNKKKRHKFFCSKGISSVRILLFIAPIIDVIADLPVWGPVEGESFPLFKKKKNCF